MDREEFMRRYDNLQDELQSLRQEYKDSQPVKAKQAVWIGNQRLWLDRYKIVGYNVYPVLYPFFKNGGVDKRLIVNVDNWRDMVPDN